MTSAVTASSAGDFWSTWATGSGSATPSAAGVTSTSGKLSWTFCSSAVGCLSSGFASSTCVSGTSCSTFAAAAPVVAEAFLFSSFLPFLPLPFFVGETGSSWVAFSTWSWAGELPLSFFLDCFLAFLADVVVKGSFAISSFLFSSARVSSFFSFAFCLLDFPFLSDFFFSFVSTGIAGASPGGSAGTSSL